MFFYFLHNKEYLNVRKIIFIVMFPSWFLYLCYFIFISFLTDKHAYFWQTGTQSIFFFSPSSIASPLAWYKLIVFDLSNNIKEWESSFIDPLLSILLSNFIVFQLFIQIHCHLILWTPMTVVSNIYRFNLFVI